MDHGRCPTLERGGLDLFGSSVCRFLRFSQGFFLCLSPALLFLFLLALAFSVGLWSWPGHSVTTFRGNINGNSTTNDPIGLWGISRYLTTTVGNRSPSMKAAASLNTGALPLNGFARAIKISMCPVSG